MSLNRQYESFTLIMKSHAASTHKRHPGFTLVELLVTITIIAVLAALGFMGSSSFLKRAGAVKDVANMKTIWSGITLYAADHNDMLPGSPTSGLFSGQKAVYTMNANNGRLACFIAPYLGYAEPREGAIIEPMLSSWQKTSVQKAVNAYWFRIDVPTATDPTTTFRPWGYAYAAKPMQMSAAMSKIDPSRTWAFTDLDQLHPDALAAKPGWLKEVPEKIAHGTYRLAMYFDGSSGKLNQKNQPN